MKTKTEVRTFAWYVLNTFEHGKGDKHYSVSPNEKYANCPSPQRHLDHYEKLGLLNEVPTYENLVPLIDMYQEWYKKVDESWSVYEKEKKKGSLLITLHWTLGNIMCDPHIDEKIIRHVFESKGKLLHVVVWNASCPEDILKSFIENAGSKSDPMRDTNGGEMTCFILQNKHISSEIVDLCARKTKRIGIQRDAANHPNVSRDTLVFLSKEGRSDTVKRDALQALVSSGMIEIK